jgi:hypothetical protein
MKWIPTTLALVLAAGAALAVKTTTTPRSPAVSGEYLEVRTCDVYTGPCVANGEMGLTGKEAILCWAVRHGVWQGARLDGLHVIAVVRSDDTLGDMRYQPRRGKAVLIVDAQADSDQREALADLAKSLAGGLIEEITVLKSLPIQARLATCEKMGCASVTAGDQLQITTRCLGDKDHLCGNEETFYPPLTPVDGAYPVFTELAAFQGAGLDVTWQLAGKRSGFLAAFAR